MLFSCYSEKSIFACEFWNFECSFLIIIRIHCPSFVARGLRNIKRVVEYGEAEYNMAIRVTWYMHAKQPKPAKFKSILVSYIGLFLLGRIVHEILTHYPTTSRPRRESACNAGKSANFAPFSKLLFHVFYVL